MKEDNKKGMFYENQDTLTCRNFECVAVRLTPGIKADAGEPTGGADPATQFKKIGGVSF